MPLTLAQKTRRNALAQQRYVKSINQLFQEAYAEVDHYDPPKYCKTCGKLLPIFSERRRYSYCSTPCYRKAFADYKRPK